MISRAVILQDNKILLIRRFKDGEEYFVLPGGHIEKGETEEGALVREIKEETSLDVQIDKKLWMLRNPHDNSEHHFFLVTEFSGGAKLGGPELQRNSEKNSYVLEWHKLDEIPSMNLVPAILKKRIIENFVAKNHREDF